MAATHLLVLGNADAARWVFEHQRMAFSEVGRRSAAKLSRGDTLIFYASLKYWPELGGPRPESGLLIADAVVLTDVARMKKPADVGGRRFDYGCEIYFEHLAPVGSGVPMGKVRDQLELTAGRANYGQALRRTPILLSRADANLLKTELARVWKPFEESVDGYRKPASPSS